MKRISMIAAALAVVPVFAFATPVMAVNEGQIEGGDIYRIKNVTKNVDFTDPANADACDVLMYKVRIHDPGPGALSNVTVKVSLPSNVATSNTSTVTVSSQNADPSSTSDNAVVNLSSSQNVAYSNGTTQLLDANGNVIKTLADGVTQGGVNIGNVGVSINNREYVQFQAKVSCPTPTPIPTPTPTPTPTTPTTPAPTKASELPNTGAGDVLGIFAGASAAGTAAHAVVSRRFRR